MKTHYTQHDMGAPSLTPQPPIRSSQLLHLLSDLKAISEKSLLDQPQLKNLINNKNLIPLSNNVLMSVVNTPIEQEMTDHFVIEEDYYGFQFVLSGNHFQILDNTERYRHAGPRMNITHFRKKTSQIRVYQAGTELVYVGAWISPSILKNDFGINPPDLDEILRQKAKNPALSSVDFPLTIQAQRLVNDIFFSSYQGQLRKVYIKAKMDELICLAMSNLTEGLQALNHPGEYLSDSKVQALEKVEQYIQEHYQNLPSVEALSASVNMSRTTLSNSFKSRYGMVISDYMQTVKMERAKELLNSGLLTVLQVANAVGYENQSSFARVYKRHFGRVPKDDKGTYC